MFVPGGRLMPEYGRMYGTANAAPQDLRQMGTRSGRFCMSSDPTGLHRVLEPHGVLPQAATRLNAQRDLWPDEVRISVERLNLDAASYRQLATKHAGDGDAIRAEVLDIITSRGKMQNPVTGS